MTGLAGASKASIDARVGDPRAAAEDYRRLITHWRRAGMWSTQWTMLRSIAGLLARLGRPRDAAVLEGAVRATAAGHRIFGADEVALDRARPRLRVALGDEAYEAARRRGAALDGDAAVEHALHACSERAPLAQLVAGVSGATPSTVRASSPATRLSPTGCMKPPARTSRHALFQNSGFYRLEAVQLGNSAQFLHDYAPVRIGLPANIAQTG